MPAKLPSTSTIPKATKWIEIALWFIVSAVFSTYLNTAFLREFNGDAIALTFVRFFGSAVLGLISNVFNLGGGSRLGLRQFLDLSPVFAFPAICLLLANLFNSVSLDRGGITLTYVVKAGIPLVTVLICLVKGQRVTALTASTLVPTVLGVALSAWADTDFAWDGFLAAWVSTVSQALLNVTSKTSIQSSGLSGQRAQLVLVTLATALMLIANIALEFLRWEPILSKTAKNETSLLVLVLVAAAYHVEYVLNFIVTENVSEVHFSVLDVARRLSIILAGAGMFGKSLTPLNVFGVCLALTGVLLFNRVKSRDTVAATSPQAMIPLKDQAEGKKVS